MDDNLPILDHRSLSEEGTPESAFDKLATLKALIRPRVEEGVVVAFSGGMDSAFLLWATHQVVKEWGGRALALTTTSPSTPARDKEDAKAFSRSLAVEHVWEESHEMSLADYSRNDRERCYHCKAELFRVTREVAANRGLQWVFYGYNASDQEDDRPGHRAAEEAGALAPLSDAELSKGEIRFLMQELGLPLSGKPASPCLSSRIMTGIEITPARLRDVEDLENILRNAGLSTSRVRVCRVEGEAFFLRVEVSPSEMGAVLDCREDLVREARGRGYRWVTMDLGGYRMGGGVA